MRKSLLFILVVACAVSAHADFSSRCAGPQSHESALTRNALFAVMGESLPASEAVCQGVETVLGEKVILDLSGQNIADLSLLSELPRLEGLNLANNRISDLSPLEGLRDLKVLILSKNQLVQAGSLSQLTALQHLELAENQLQSVDFVRGMSSLAELNLAQNPITNIAPLSEITGLGTLVISDTLVSDLAPLASLRDLKVLSVAGARVTHFEVLSDLQRVHKMSDGTQQKLTIVGKPKPAQVSGGVVCPPQYCGGCRTAVSYPIQHRPCG